MLNPSLGERLRRLQITGATFAGVIGLHQATLSLYINGHANPSPATEEKIMSTLCELERLSRLLPVLPNFRGVTRVQALLLTLRGGGFAEYERIATAVAAVAAVAAVGSSVGHGPQAEQVSRGDVSATEPRTA
jgi:hypothetical protein